MTKNSLFGIVREYQAEGNVCPLFRPRSMNLALLSCAILMAVSGCETQTPPKGFIEPATAHSEAISLREGDVLKISFPSAPTLNTTQQIRRDGQISLPLGLGELKAAGMTPAELEKKLIDLYASQLVQKQVTVTVDSSSFPVFVTGMIIRPGKIASDHPITALEAIMEAGGPDYTKANLKAVRVTRLEGGQFKTYTLNLKLVLDGKQTTPFYLKPGDIVYVPERFSWF
jgi:polysaccharide biosynthesis/export protein